MKIRKPRKSARDSLLVNASSNGKVKDVHTDTLNIARFSTKQTVYPVRTGNVWITPIILVSATLITNG